MKSEHILSEFNKKAHLIHPDRKSLLDDLVILIKKQEGTIRINFICTHNSRRSQLAELLCFYISRTMGIDTIKSYSGGTEATAFNIRMINALKSLGFDIQNQGYEDNPIYLFQYNDEDKYMFSKIYDHESNPNDDFIAITVCSDADQNCPYMPGADHRFHLSFEDPKAYDGTVVEGEKYKEKIYEIGSELYYILATYKNEP